MNSYYEYIKNRLESMDCVKIYRNKILNTIEQKKYISVYSFNKFQNEALFSLVDDGTISSFEKLGIKDYSDHCFSTYDYFYTYSDNRYGL